MIEVINLEKTFRTSKKFPGLKGAIKSLFTKEYTEKKAINNISFSIPDGQITGYIGSNGAGKSTTIKIMTGILTPTNGKVLVEGKEPYKCREENAKNIGVVFGQRTQLWWDLPLCESFTILQKIYEIPEIEFKERLDYFTELLGLDEFFMQPVRTLSLGQRMKADLAASLLHNPKILFLDEPTIGLDVLVKEKVRKAIKEINEKYGTTIILTTHDMQDIEQLCQRIILIDQGKIVYDGNLENLKKQYGDEGRIVLRLDSDEKECTPEKIQSLFKKNIVATFNSDGAIVVTFNLKDYTTSKILQKLLGTFKVADFSAEGASIENIVKKIYRDAE